MKFTLLFWILSALMIAISAMMRLATGESRDDSDNPAPVPRITARQVQQYAYVGGTDQEIADRFAVDVKFVRQKFFSALRVGRALRKLAIRSWQMELCRKLNGPMLTWIGRNELGQSLNPEQSGGDEPEFQAE